MNIDTGITSEVLTIKSEIKLIDLFLSTFLMKLLIKNPMLFLII